MKLFFAPDTCSLSPHIVLHELGIPHSLVRINNRTKRTSEGGDFLSINPKGYVAALQLDSGDVITEGAAIVQYLSDLKPEANLAAQNGTLDRIRIQEWLNFITSELHSASSPLFNKEISDSSRAIITAKVRKRLDYVDGKLEGTEYLFDGRFTVADAYLYTVLLWMKFFSIDLKDWTNISRFMLTVSDRPSVKKAEAAEAATDPVE